LGFGGDKKGGVKKCTQGEDGEEDTTFNAG
jgi:hypothetical protein